MIKTLKTTKQFKDVTIGNESLGLTDSYVYLCQYIELLELPLELDMFVPCLDGVPLEKPLDWKNEKSPLYNPDTCHQCQQAESKVLFKGFNYEDGWVTKYGKSFLHKDGAYFRGGIIKDLLKESKDIEVTEAFNNLITK